jgi:hypothetical protein
VGRELRGELPVAFRVDHVGARAEHRDARGSAGEPAAVGGRVDAECQAAHDGEACVRQGVREGLRIQHAARRGVAAADDGEAGRVQQVGAADHIQHGRRIGDFEQRPGILGVRECHEAMARLLEPAKRALERFRGRAQCEALGHVTGNDVRCRCERRGHRPGGRAELTQQRSLPRFEDTGGQREAKPGDEVVAH